MWIRINEAEKATILAALRYWQRQALQGPTVASGLAEYDIATNGGALEHPLDLEDVDTLCESLNRQPTERENFIRKLAFDELDADDVTILDDGNVYECDEGGAWVDAQMWIHYEVCSKCNAIEGSPEWGTVGDGFDGMCPSCADKEEQED